MTAPGQIVVRRVGELRGTIDVPGAKNSVLKLMAATLLAPGRSVIADLRQNVTALGDQDG